MGRKVHKEQRIDVAGRWDELVAKFADATVIALVSFVLSSAIIGGSTYLLLEVPKERDAYMKKVAEFGNRADRYRDFITMFEVYMRGWAGSNLAHLKRYEEIREQLVVDLARQELDENFAQGAFTWIGEVTGQLARDKGRIQGFTFEDKADIAIQKSLVDYYDAQLGKIKATNEMMLTIKKRDLSNIDKYLQESQRWSLHSLQALGELETKLLTLMTGRERDKRIIEQQFVELQTESWGLVVKDISARLGIMVGLFILSGTCFLLFRGRSSRTKPG